MRHGLHIATARRNSPRLLLTFGLCLSATALVVSAQAETFATTATAAPTSIVTATAGLSGGNGVVSLLDTNPNPDSLTSAAAGDNATLNSTPESFLLTYSATTGAISWTYDGYTTSYTDSGLVGQGFTYIDLTVTGTFNKNVTASNIVINGASFANVTSSGSTSVSQGYFANVVDGAAITMTGNLAYAGNSSNVAGLTVSLGDETASIAATPEPGTLFCAGSGVIGLAFLGRRARAVNKA